MVSQHRARTHSYDTDACVFRSEHGAMNFDTGSTTVLQHIFALIKSIKYVQLKCNVMCIAVNHK